MSTYKKPVPLLWRIIIVFGAAALIWIANGLLLGGEEYSPQRHVMSAVFISLLVVPLVVIARRYLDRRPWRGLRLTFSPAGWRAFGIGMLCYLIPSLAGLTVFILMGWIEINIQLSAGELVLAILTIAALVFFYEALPEELLFRGYLYRNLNQALPRWQSVAVQAILFVLFAWLIGAAADLTRILIFLGVGVIVGMIRVTTEHVSSAIGFHVAFQTMQQLFSNRRLDEIASSSPGLMEMVILGILPFSFAILTLRLFVKKQPDWSRKQPE